ncbi:MAG: hypothetical protein C5B50_03735 [Verrucomicrobia bacterium]|nr:MAG: hypothetical protein C5B50_03735 [Verrucomicrobiota bacterium]
MGYQASVRAFAAAQRREEREAQKRLRELQRQAKEQAKLDEAARASLEVETFERELDVLLSIHKGQHPPFDWTAIAAALPPPVPARDAFNEFRARQRLEVLPASERADSDSIVEQARSRDDENFQKAMQVHAEEMSEWEKMRTLARRVLAGEHKAYIDCLQEFNPFAEIADLGSTIHFTIHTSKLIECVLKVNGKQAIPKEMKTLTVSKKVAVKPMPKARFHELYLDYLCGCAFRVGREIFALLPVSAALVAARADSVDPSTGKTTEQAVLSVFMPRDVMAQLDFDRLDPFLALANFQHRGDLTGSRKSESFRAIVPLTSSDVPHLAHGAMSLQELIHAAEKLRGEITAEIAQNTNTSNDTALQAG